MKNYISGSITTSNGATDEETVLDLTGTAGKNCYIYLKTDQNISIKFNDTDQDSITLRSAVTAGYNFPLTTFYQKTRIDIEKIYVTNASGSTSHLDYFILLDKWASE